MASGSGIGSLRARAWAAGIALMGALVIAGGTALASPPSRRTAAIDTASPTLPQLHVKMTFSYRVVGRTNTIRSFNFTGVPLDFQVTVRCLGHCFTRRLHKNLLNFGSAIRFVSRRTFYAGQKLVFTFTAPGYTAVTFILKMIYNNDPRLSIYKPPKPHHRH